MSGLLLASVSTLAFAFLPLLLYAAGVPSATVWVAASSAHAVYLVGALAYRARQLPGLSVADRPAFILLGVPLLTITTIGLQAANALFIHASWPYLTAIVLMLLVTFATFAILLHSLGSAA